MIGCLIFTVILAFLSVDSLTVVYQENDLQIGQTPFMFVKQLLTANWIFIIAGSAVVVVGAMLITHRIAGPLFRLERAVDNMSRGQLNDIIYLRKKDEGKELAAKLNHFNNELSRDLRHMERQSHNIEDLLVQYSSLNPENTSFEDYDSLFNSIARQNKVVLEIIEKYQLIE
jgi:nitrogen fixation/metabolism regulation signal transduction histidine kinase